MLMQPISEAELIEIEHRMWKIESYVGDRLTGANRMIEVCKSGQNQFDDVMTDLRRLIAQTRAGQLCCECGARIEPTGTRISGNR
jgi:hypothetical protein